MNPASRSARPSRPDKASTAAPAGRDDRPGRPPRRVWAWLRSCGRFARSESASQAADMSAGRLFLALVADFRLKLARLGDQLLDRLLGRHQTDEFTPGVHVLHI